MTNETLEKHEKTCDICQTTNPENKIGKRLATKAIQRNSEKVMTSKKQTKGKLYDTQGIEGLARVGDKEKLTGREWIIQRFIEWNYGESNFSFGTQELHHAIDLTIDEEREKCKFEFAQMFVDAAKDAEEKGRREERKRCDEKIEDAYAGGEQFGRRETAKEIFLAIEEADRKSPYSELPTEYNLIKARFLGKEAKE